MPSESLEQSVTLPADHGRDQASLWKEIHKLQRTIRRLQEKAAGDGGIEMVFNYTGALVVGRSQQFVLRRDADLVTLYITLTAATTNSTFVIYKNAVVLDTSIVPANTPEFEKPLSYSLLKYDGISFGATVVGTGAADVVAQLRAL